MSEERLLFSFHALRQMEKRRLTREDALVIVSRVQPFRYWHRRQWMEGYWDPQSGVMVAVGHGGVVATVMVDFYAEQVEILKGRRP